jgi:AcrR family transcriptional regulator
MHPSSGSGDAPGPDVPETEAAAEPSTQSGGKRGRSSKATRETILKTALQEFAEQGYEGATTASIARKVGVTQPLIHYHFGSKQGSTVDSIFGDLAKEVESAETRVEGMGDAAKLVTLTYSFIDFAVAHPELARMINNEGVVHSERLTWMVDSYIKPLFDRWGGYFDRAKEAGLLRNIPTPYVMTALLGASQQFFDLAPLVQEVYGIDSRDPEHVRDFGDAVVQIFLEGASARDDDDPDALEDDPEDDPEDN